MRGRYPLRRPLGLPDRAGRALRHQDAARAAARAAIDARIAEVIDRGAFILGPEVAAFEAEFAAYLGARARGRRGQRHRRDHAGAAGARRRPGRRGRRALVHVLRLGRGDPPHGRAAGVLRRRPGDVLRHGGDRARGADAAHEGGDRGAPVRQRRAGARDRGARRAGARGRRPGRRLARRRRAGPARWARSRRSPSSRRRTSACFGDGGAVTTGDARARRAGADAALPRLARQGDVRAGRPQLAPGRAAGRRSCACCSRTSTAGATAAARRRRPTSAAGLGELVDAARAPWPAPRPRGTST